MDRVGNSYILHRLKNPQGLASYNFTHSKSQGSFLPYGIVVYVINHLIYKSKPLNYEKNESVSNMFDNSHSFIFVLQQGRE